MDNSYLIDSLVYEEFIEDFKMGLITKEQLRYACFQLNMNINRLSQLYELGVITKDELYTHLFPSSYVSEKKRKIFKK